jgi:hypothetical protein
MVENAVAYFYHDDLALVDQAPVLLDGLPAHSRGVILANVRKASSLTLGILKSLYPQTDLDAQMRASSQPVQRTRPTSWLRTLQ